MRYQSMHGWLLLVATAVFGCDRGLKLFFLQKFTVTGVGAASVAPDFVRVNDWLNFTLAFNRGAAFGFLHRSEFAGPLFIAIAVLALLIFGVILARLLQNGAWMESWWVMFVMSGVIGNLYDRIAYGYVVDYIQLHWRDYYWPTFNLADILICLGVCGWIYIDMRNHSRSCSSEVGLDQ